MRTTWNAPRLLSSLLLAAFAGGACVTVNVNFPESAVQKATDDYVKDLYRAKEKGKGTTPAAEPSMAPVNHTSETRMELIASAWADDQELFKVRSENALKIRDKLAAQVDEVLEHKRSGALGETKDGLLVLKDSGKLKKLLLKRVERLVQDENGYRRELYEEILKTNGLPDSRLRNIQSSFSRSFQAESPSGTWVEDPDGKWSRKP